MKLKNLSYIYICNFKLTFNSNFLISFKNFLFLNV